MILVASTCAPYKCDGSELNWLENAERLRRHTEEDLFFFAALEKADHDAFDRLRWRLHQLGGDFWSFSLDDNARLLTSSNRLIRICMGRNLIVEYAMRAKIGKVLFLDTDLLVPDDTIPKLLEMKHPLVGGDVPSYCLKGKRVDGYDYPVEEHWNTAGFLLVETSILGQVAWHYDPLNALTDDPTFGRDTLRLGFPTYVRKDVIGRHVPLIPMENRGHDRRLA